MNKYIDAETLKRSVESIGVIPQKQADYNDGRDDMKMMVLDLIESLQQEQPEDIVVIAKTFLDALSKTPYNNKPITDAQIIVRQLLLFFDSPASYNPDAIVEQPEVDSEKEINKFFDHVGMPVYWCNDAEQQEFCSNIARHFYKLRNRALEEAARRVYESWMGGTMDDVRRDMVELGKVLNTRKEGQL